VNAEISKVLAQMRSLQSAVAPQPTTPQPGQPDFGAVLREAVDKVSAQQGAASDMATAFQTGSTDASVAEVMVAMQKASLSFQAMTEVRNKLVDAYQEIMNMPI
jgi:flagellar hook-basal body complex protein FliE